MNRHQLSFKTKLSVVFLKKVVGCLFKQSYQLSFIVSSSVLPVVSLNNYQLFFLTRLDVFSKHFLYFNRLFVEIIKTYVFH